jgi:hypothetical protein
MNSRQKLFILLVTAPAIAVIVSGCKGKEAMVPGTWKGMGATFIAKDEHTFTGSDGTMTFAGTWKVTGDDVTFTETTYNGMPVEKVKEMLDAHSENMPKRAKDYIEDLDRPNILRISDDGKYMLTDASKDRNISDGAPLSLSKTE